MSTLARNFKGLLGTKLGMTQVFDAAGHIVPVTVVQAGPCTVAQVKTPERDGYAAVQLAFGEVKPKRVNKPLKGHFAKSGVEPRRHLVELRTADAGNYSAGQELKPDEVFAQGERVDVIGVSKGKRFAGHMGHERVTVLNLEVAKIDPERSLLLVRGAVPGPKGGLVMIRSAVQTTEGVRA